MARHGKVAEIKKGEDQTNFKLISKDGDEGFSPRIYFQRLDHQRHRLRGYRAVQTCEASGLGMQCHYVKVDRELEDVGLPISLVHKVIYLVFLF
jgi:hypothetical protein